MSSNLVYSYLTFVTLHEDYWSISLKSFVVGLNDELKAARKALADAGAPLAERKPFSTAIQTIRDYRKALDAGEDPCTPIPDI